jgi:hypothetical protein
MESTILKSGVDYMKRIVKNLILVLILGFVGFVYYYLALPAFNIHSPGLWFFMIGALLLATIILVIYHAGREYKQYSILGKELFRNKSILITGGCTLAILLFLIIGSILSSPIVNARRYQKLLTPTERSFTEDIRQISYKDIPILDKDSASLLGSRKMGSIMEYVSQFEVADNYTQINYQNKPVRVTPLRYGNFFKWLNNRGKGIPAYIRIDMATQEVELVKLEQGIKYSESEHFSRNIYRYLRFNYPTYIFDTINFEIDDEGTPFWICPVKKFNIGLFGGQTIGKVVLVNAVTGDHTEYPIEEVPTWVDRVYSADLLISLYDYHGTLKHGYWNSVIGQRDALQTTDGYNYLVLEDDVWVYTGVTSVGADESNVGFVLMNQRTAETRFYTIAGAEEYSAMSSAEGKVQHLGYKATFPLLLNIGNQPTYFMALKDAGGLVKSYAMVNIAQYQIVAIGDSVSDCEKTYVDLMRSNGVGVDVNAVMPRVTGKIAKLVQAVVDGNSHYYILLSNHPAIFDVNVADFIGIIRYDIGDTITFTYSEGEEANTVTGIE